MSEKEDGWFHCGRCGGVFQSQMGDLKDRRCPDCGSNPSLGHDPQAAAPVGPAIGSPAGATSVMPGKVSQRRRKPMSLAVKLIVGWSVVALVLAVLTRIIDEDLPKNEKFVSKRELAQRTITAEDAALLEKTVPLCTKNFSGFLGARTPEERNQFVSSPITTAGRMARFYQLNSLMNFDPATLALHRSAVLHLPKGPAIETQWRSVTGGLFDAVFIQENGEWRLDWEHYVRFSDYPWPLFLAGGGEDRGEFRLLARERLAGDRRGLDTISIVLGTPRLGYARDVGTQSPEILVPRDSKNGRLLTAAFKLEKEKKRPFGLQLDSINPDEFIRIRATVARSKTEQGYAFEIQDIAVAHWYSEVDPGMALLAEPSTK